MNVRPLDWAFAVVLCILFIWLCLESMNTANQSDFNQTVVENMKSQQELNKTNANIHQTHIDNVNKLRQATLGR